jgi:hypothetical protein
VSAWAYIDAHPWLTLLWLFLVMSGVESIVKAWRSGR